MPALDQLKKEFPEFFAYDSGKSTLLFGIECGEGWYDILYDLCVELRNMKADLKMVQIKEKFGALRVYTDSKSLAVYDLIRAAEDRSRTICEVCGASGTSCSRADYIMVRCKKHAKQTRANLFPQENINI